MFDLDKFLTTSPIDVNATDIRFMDARTGEEFRKTIFRPGKCVSFVRVAEELAHYGYTLIWMDDQPANIPGRMNWSDLFGEFMEQEGLA